MGNDTKKVLGASLVALSFLVACGGSASRDRQQLPSAEGGADTGGADTGGVSGKGGTGGTVATGFVDAGRGGGGTGGVNPSVGGSLVDPGGMGGDSATPTLSLPAGCEPRARTETADTCSLAVYCDTASLLTNCRRLESGRWQCQCEPAHKDRVFQMQGAPGLQACALAAQLCAQNELELGEESCDPIRENIAADSCQIDLDCGKPIALDPPTDARAWLMRFGSASCQPAESGKPFTCGCSDGETATDYDLLVDSGAPACRPLVDFCMSGKTPDLEGDKQCLLTNAVASADGCERSEVCGASMPLNGDVSLARLEPRYAKCEPRAGGGAECYCSNRDSTFGFQLAASPDDASCESSMLNCSADAVIEANGAASCQPTSLTAFGDSCESDLTCLQPATVDDREIVAEGRLLLACARVAPGMPWWCSCASDQVTARFQLGAAALSPWQACGQAPAGCLEQMDVHIGLYGEFVQPPDPLEPLP